MWTLKVFALSIAYIYSINADAATDYNDVNRDGSFSFGLSNNDIGGHYHSASGSADGIVRGRYGSRNPESGRIDETTYTAGPRGFRASGPLVHRKVDLSQYPVGPKGSPEDPLADPYDDPSYTFSFTTPDNERRESSDGTGRVRGLYSYLDDVGERHTVRYAAGAGSGYEVSNAVPDSPSVVNYNAPLYKAPRQTRGRMSVQRGPDGQYKFIASGPDQRRSESIGPDGVVRGSYSYLDDKGIQRTVQYIAGAGIGYRVVQSTVGAGTHTAPRPAIPEFGIPYRATNDISDDPYFNSPSGRPVRPGATISKPSSFTSSAGNDFASGSFDGSYRGSQTFLGDFEELKDRKVVADRRNDGATRRHGTASSSITGSAGGYSDQPSDNTNRGNSYNNDSRRPSVGKDSREEGYSYNRGSSSFTTERNRGNSYLNRGGSDGSYSSETEHSNNSKQSRYKGAQNRGNHRYYDDFPTVSNDRNRLESDRNRDWQENGRDSTLVRNIGKWYVGLPPGGAVRAHVQNIDLLPLGGRRIESPSDALRRDELDHL